MDSRGPPEGAPDDPLASPVVDKLSDIPDNWTGSHLVVSGFGDQSKKPNNTLLFLTVGYMDDQNGDYCRMFPSYEQAPFALPPASPLSDFEQQVSTLDPNMSSAARYSPTPVPLPPLPFSNSVVAFQGPPSPFVVQAETNPRTNINFAAARNCDRAATPTDDIDDFVNDGNDSLGSDTGEELILMQGENSELESTATPLLLTEISGTEFPLTRDFLVIHGDRSGVADSSRNEETIEKHVPMANESNVSAVIDETSEINVRDDASTIVTKTQKIDDETRTVRRSGRRINDKKTFWFDDHENGGRKTGDGTSENVRTIADQPVPSRAIATLPGSYLSLNELPSVEVLPGCSKFGVFAKRFIGSRTQFGPIEGILWPYSGATFDNGLPLIYETETGEFMKIDVSNENASNWMRFVRPASTYREQNLGICQQGDGIVFLTTRNILPKEELRAGPNPEYARRRNLTILQPQVKDEPNDASLWPCFECNRHFGDYDKLTKHLSVHDNAKCSTKSKSKRRKSAVSTKKLLKIVDGQTLFYACPHCPKIFPRSYSLKRHLSLHPGHKSNRQHVGSYASENFAHSQNRRAKIFRIDGTREKENSRQNSTDRKCAICNLTYGRTSTLSGRTTIRTSKSGDRDIHDDRCSKCDEKFRDRNDAYGQIAKNGCLQLRKTTNITPVALYKCNVCYKRFATKIRLQQHCLVHGDEDQKPLPCNVCAKRFMNNSALSCHLKTHLEDKRTFECPICRELFNQILTLRDHIENHRNDDDTFTCPHCSRIFAKYSFVRKHIRAHHCERKHKCQFCAKRFPSVDKLRMHLLRHSDHREFNCANCEKRFKRKDKLKEHMTRMHTAQRVKRDQTSQNNQIKKFIPKVNPTDYNRFVYKCHQCLVGFKRRGMLVNHLAKRHPDVAPESVPELNLPILRQTRDYYCQYCDKVYKSSSKRKAHIVKNHPGAALPPSNRQKEADVVGLPNPTFSQTVGSVRTTPQGCQWCHKQYASKAKLLQHQRKKHSSLMAPADQVPRSRTRSFSKVIQTSTNHVDIEDSTIIDYMNERCGNGEFSKSTMIEITTGIETIGNGLEIVGQQLVRMRDVR